MLAAEIIDTYPAFLTYWARVQDRPLDEQIARWAAEYLAPWPDLLAMQVDDYAAQGADWRQVARERVFPYLAGRLSAQCFKTNAGIHEAGGGGAALSTK